MKQKIWLLTWDDGDATAFEKLEDARDYALNEVREGANAEEIERLIRELNENYDEYKGFYIEGWFWCNAINFYR